MRERVFWRERYPEHGGDYGGGEQALFGAEEDGVAEGGGDDPEPAVDVGSGGAPAFECVEGQGDAEEGEGFGEGGGGVVGGEGAEGGEPEDGHGGAVVRRGGRRGRRVLAAEQVYGGLDVHDGVVMLHAEEAEADGEEDGVAGEADDGGAGRWTGSAGAEVAEAVDAVLQPVFGDVAVDECVAGDARDVVDVPETEDEVRTPGRWPRTARTETSAG